MLRTFEMLTLLCTGCHSDAVRRDRNIAYRVQVENMPRIPSRPSTWTNTCVEIPRLVGEEESTRQWVSRIRSEIEADASRRLVSVSYPLEHHEVDLALVCFTADRFE